MVSSIAASLAGAMPALDGHAIVGGTAARHAMDPTRALIDRALSGDPGAFRQIFAQHRGDVARLVYRMLGPVADVEDVVQEIFLHVYRSLPSFRGDARFSTWLYRLAVNVTRMHIRRARSRPRFADVEVPEAPAWDAPSDSPEHLTERAERVRSLYRLLDGLSEKKREGLVLHDLEGVPAKDIAEMVGAPVLTVRTRLFYARKELYAAMQAEPSLSAVVEALMQTLPGRPSEDSRGEERRGEERRGDGRGDGRGAARADGETARDTASNGRESHP